jgi:hypothetical protein
VKEAAALIAVKYGLHLREESSASILQIAKSSELTFEVTVPHAVLEWFASASQANKEIWSEWADYYSVRSETQDELASAMAEDVALFVAKLVARPTRVAASSSGPGQSRGVQWFSNESWSPVSLSEA